MAIRSIFSLLFQGLFDVNSEANGQEELFGEESRSCRDARIDVDDLFG